MSKYLCIKTLEYHNRLFDSTPKERPYIKDKYYELVEKTDDSIRLVNEHGKIHTITNSWRKFFLSPEELRSIKIKQLMK